jgi:hypothetical protein
MAELIDLEKYRPQKGKVLQQHSRLLYTMRGHGKLWFANHAGIDRTVTHYVYENGPYDPATTTYTVYQEAADGGASCIGDPDLVQMLLAMHFAKQTGNDDPESFTCTGLGLERLFDLLPEDMLERAVTACIATVVEGRNEIVMTLLPLLDALVSSYKVLQQDPDVQ